VEVTSMNAKKAAVSDRRSAQAVEIFEKAMRALGKRDYERAKEHFESLLSAHAEERDVAERARLYLGVCRRALDKKPAFKPKTFDELLKFLGQAADQQPKNEHVLYCLAASAAQSGDVSGALKSLRAAIQANPASRAQARADGDFDPIRENEEFVEILDAEA
jgi:outer membrane protein assembly factor BamD (BamD/ComL family)